jgi:hypothetical protein
VSFLVLESADNVRLTVQHNASPEGFIMDRVLRKVEDLALLHDRIDAKIIREKNIKLGLRNQDGSGVFVGITSKGQVIGYERVIRGDGTESVNRTRGPCS